jgi:hypothetical protein
MVSTRKIHSLMISILLAVTINLLFNAPIWSEEIYSPLKNTSEWKVGYWAWETSYKPLDNTTVDSKPVQLLYIQVGEYHSRLGQEDYDNEPFLHMPGNLPLAENYIAVLRLSFSKSPDHNIISRLVENYLALKREAKSIDRQLIGLQLDYDCPTNRLSDYALFLKSLRTAFPPNELLSITVLLDWFRPGTDIAGVIGQVDEFVPQFYDVNSGNTTDISTGVARVIEPKWGEIFNSYAKPYLIGIATFGRIFGINRSNNPNNGKLQIKTRILDANLFELMADNHLIPLSSTTNEAGERLVRYNNTLKKKRDNEYAPTVDEVKMIIPTNISILKSYTAAKAMGGQCKGAIFFRWPLVNEAMVFTQAEIHNIISGRGSAIMPTPRLKVEDGLCAASICTDMFLTLQDRFPLKPIRFRIHSSKNLEYIVPDRLLKPRMIGEHIIELTIPADVGVPKIHVGRALSFDVSEFTLEEVNKK